MRLKKKKKKVSDKKSNSTITSVIKMIISSKVSLNEKLEKKALWVERQDCSQVKLKFKKDNNKAIKQRRTPHGTRND